MTQLTDIRMNGEEEEKRGTSKKERRKSSSRADAERTDLEKEDDSRIQQAEDGPEGGKKFGGSSPVRDAEANIPLVRIHQATPSPRPPDQSEDADEKRRKKRSKRREKKDEPDEGLEEEDETASDENGDEDEEEEDVEEEEEDLEMTQEEKKAMYEAVIEGDIDALEDCLDLPNSDINMIWFQENLLMAAIRAGHVDVAEFLLDNGVDSTFSTSVVDVQETPDGKIMERYEVDCRQMAYDCHLQDVVFLIDLLQDNLFPFIPRPVRTPRLRRPKPEPSDDGDTEGDDADDESQSGGSADVSDSSSDLVGKEEGGVVDSPLSEGDQQKKKRKKKRKREQRKKRSRVNSAAEDDGVMADNVDDDEDDDGKRTATADEEDGEKDKTFRTGSTSGDVDSGNHSMASSKLKKSMLQKHDELLEKEERSGSNSADSPRKSETESTQTKSQSQKTKGDGTDRTSTTVTQDRGQSSSGPVESRTASQSIVPEIPEWAAVLNPPTNRIRSTRAVVAAKQGNLARNFYKSPLHASTTERPLKWRKISTTGSYARESRRWHLENKIEEVNDEKVKISQLSITPLFPPSSSAPNSVPASSASFCSKSQKSQRASMTPSDVSESISIASLSIQDRVDRFSKPKSIPKRSSPLQNSASEVASYMRPTQSTITKQRLGTQFVDSYGGLGFCPNPSKSTNFHMGMMKSSGKLQINGTAAAAGALSRSHRVPVLTTKSVAQRRNENVISYRM